MSLPPQTPPLTLTHLSSDSPPSPLSPLLATPPSHPLHTTKISSEASLSLDRFASPTKSSLARSKQKNLAQPVQVKQDGRNKVPSVTNQEQGSNTGSATYSARRTMGVGAEGLTAATTTVVRTPTKSMAISSVMAPTVTSRARSTPRSSLLDHSVPHPAPTPLFPRSHKNLVPIRARQTPPAPRISPPADIILLVASHLASTSQSRTLAALASTSSSTYVLLKSILYRRVSLSASGVHVLFGGLQSDPLTGTTRMVLDNLEKNYDSAYRSRLLFLPGNALIRRLHNLTLIVHLEFRNICSFDETAPLANLPLPKDYKVASYRLLPNVKSLSFRAPALRVLRCHGRQDICLVLAAKRQRYSDFIRALARHCDPEHLCLDDPFPSYVALNGSYNHAMARDDSDLYPHVIEQIARLWYLKKPRSSLKSIGYHGISTQYISLVKVGIEQSISFSWRAIRTSWWQFHNAQTWVNRNMECASCVAVSMMIRYLESYIKHLQADKDGTPVVKWFPHTDKGPGKCSRKDVYRVLQEAIERPAAEEGQVTPVEKIVKFVPTKECCRACTRDI